MAQHMVYNRDDVGQGFPRTGASSQNIVFPRLGNTDCILLMFMKLKILPCWIFFALIAAENHFTCFMYNAFIHQLIDSEAGLKGWIKLNQRIRPE